MIWSILILTGCSGETAPPDPEPTEKAAEMSPVEKAAAIAKAIDAAPDDADSVLEEHGMSEAEYRDLLYEIAEDPAMSEEFLAATE